MRIETTLLVMVLVIGVISIEQASATVTQSKLQYQLNNNYTDMGTAAQNTAEAGTGNNFSTTTKKTGTHSLAFNGSGYATKNAPTGLATGNTALTTTFWIYLTSQIPSGTYVSPVHFGDVDTYDACAMMSYQNVTNIMWIQWGGRGELRYYQNIPIGTWTHIAATYNTNKSVQLYINGTLVSSATTANNLAMSWSNGAIGIGATESGYNKVKTGTYMDDVRYYESVLTASQIAEIYYAGTGTECNPITASCPSTSPTTCSTNLGSATYVPAICSVTPTTCVTYLGKAYYRPNSCQDSP